MAKLIVVADSHAGSRFGLLSPETVLYEPDQDGSLVPYKPNLTSTQKGLHQQYVSTLEEIKRIVGDEIIYYLHAGDICQGNRFGTELVSDRMADQIIMARDNQLPIFEQFNLKKACFITGTDIHSFGRDSSEILVAESLKQTYSEVEITTASHIAYTVEDKIIDVAHHGPYPGSRYMLKGNAARLAVKDYIQEYISWDKQPPDVIIRAHYHTYVKEVISYRYKGKMKETTLILCPPMCFPDKHSTKSARSPSFVSFGILLLEISDTIKVDEFIDSIDLRSTGELN